MRGVVLGYRHSAENFERTIAAMAAGSTPDRDQMDRDLLERSEVVIRLMALQRELSSSIREPLDRRLAQALEERRDDRVEWVLATRRFRPIPVFSAIAVFMVVLVLVPAARTAIARPLAQLLEVVGIGDHSQITRSEPPESVEVSGRIERLDNNVAAGQSWFVHTPYGGFGGDVPPGNASVVQPVDSLEQLQSQAMVQLQIPTGEHRGRPVEFSHAQLAPGGFVLMYFGSGLTELLLSEAQVGGRRAIAYQRMVSHTNPDGKTVYEEPPLMTEELTLNGHHVVWDPDNTGTHPNLSALRWEDNGISYSLMGQSLTREEAAGLFLSLRPVGQ